MKVKRLPEDFQVEELSEFTADGGTFALFRLHKKSLGTPEAIDAMLRHWNIPRNRVSYGGLKDWHAVTEQFVTIENGPKRDLRLPHCDFKYLGQAERAFVTADIAGNRFRLVMRDMSDDEVDHAVAALVEVSEHGLPNYFDDQRFGSVGESGDFVARAWAAGDYERALWLVLADPNDDDRSHRRAEKKQLREHWGNWKKCAAGLKRGPTRNVLRPLLEKPDNFRDALAAIRFDLRTIYLSAYQSHLWNRLLARLIEHNVDASQLKFVKLGIDRVPFYRTLAAKVRDDLQATELPLPSARQKLEPGPIKALCDEVLTELGTNMESLRIAYPRNTFFSKAQRHALFSPQGLEHRIARDDLYPGQKKVTLSFDLPRGCYATILVKRITTVAAPKKQGPKTWPKRNKERPKS